MQADLSHNNVSGNVPSTKADELEKKKANQSDQAKDKVTTKENTTEADLVLNEDLNSENDI